MPAKKYQVYLSREERRYLKQLVRKGTSPARHIRRAQVLLKADVSQGEGWSDEAIRTFLELAPNTVARIRQRFCEVGLMRTVQGQPPRRHYPTRLDGDQEAHLIALACGAPPEGHARWSLRLLAERMVALDYVETVSHETVRQVLKKRTEAVA